MERGHTARGCPCLAAGRWCHGLLAATLDRKLIASWWEENPRFGVGVACGPANLVVIDVDARFKEIPGREALLPGIAIDERVDLTGLSTGFHTLGLLAAFRSAPDPTADQGTLRVRTPSGGMHIWYRAPQGTRFRNSVGELGRGLAWQTDVRADGGFIVAPGTRTRDGLYVPEEPFALPAPLPAWLATELERAGHVGVERAVSEREVPRRARQAVVRAGGGAAYARRAMESSLAEVELCAQQREGAGFNDKLNRASYVLGGLAAAGHLTLQEAEQALLGAAAHARPHQMRHNQRVVAAGLEAGAR